MVQSRAKKESTYFLRSDRRSDMKMRSIAGTGIVALLTMLVWALVPPANAEILDRVMAVVGAANTKQIITLSDVRREREIQRVIGLELTNDRDVLDFLIERQLTEDQMAQFSGIEPTDRQIEETLREISDLRGVEREAVRDAVAREIKRKNYLQQRFGQFIHPTDQELKDYYETVFAPEARRRGATPPSFDSAMQSPEVAAVLQRGVAAEKMNHQVDVWLETIKRRSGVEIFQ